MLLRRAAQQAGPQHRSTFQIERDARLRVHPGLHLLIALPRGQPAQVVHPQQPRVRLVNDLDQVRRRVVDYRRPHRRVVRCQGGTQRRVPGHQRVERRGQRGHVQRPAEPVRQRHQIGGWIGVEAAQRPHLALLVGGRDRVAGRVVPARHDRSHLPGPHDVGHRVRLLLGVSSGRAATDAAARSQQWLATSYPNLL